MFILSTQTIDPTELRKKHLSAFCGAIVTFEGIVRSDKYQGKEVSSLLYIADEDACLAEGEKIIHETLAQFPVNHVLCVQRIGQLNAGETAIWIGVFSGHRDEAFKACRYMIEETKKRLLIWKKEHFNDGTSQWVRTTQTPITV